MEHIDVAAIMRVKNLLDEQPVPPITCFYDRYKGEVVEANEQNVREMLTRWKIETTDV